MITNLITILIINIIVQINAQQLSQTKMKTFANTQFNVDPNLPFHGYSMIATTELPEISRQKSHLSAMVQPTVSAATSNIQQQADHSRSKLTKFQEPQQQDRTIRVHVHRAPRAKSEFTVSTKLLQGSTILSNVKGQNNSSEAMIHDGESKPHWRTDPYTILTSNFSIKNHSRNNQAARQLLLLSLSPSSSSSSSSSSLPSLSSSSSLSSLTTSPTVVHGAASVRSPPPVITALGSVIKSGTALVPLQRTTTNSRWFNDTLPSLDCSKDFQQIAMEFQRKFPANTVRDVREKRLAEVIKQRLTDCDSKTKNNHWQNMIALLAKAKLSPSYMMKYQNIKKDCSEEEGCSNGLVQERIACLNLLSYTCQFISRDYTFRLVPARVIVQEARIIEDGIAKCSKAMRIINKYNHI